MKKLVKLALVLTLVSGGVFAEEKMSDVAEQAAMQTAISKKIEAVKSMQSIEDISEDVQASCDSIQSKIKANEEALILVTADCDEKIKLIESLDLETAKGLMIADLEEVQTAATALGYGTTMMSRCAAKGGYSCPTGPLGTLVSGAAFMLIPAAVAFDILTLPIALIYSAVYGL